jgi:amino-acid N-acetyltransferase
VNAPLEYSPASPRDAEAIRRLLAENALPGDDIDRHLDDFFVARRDDVLVGVAGLEVLGADALLRSVAVSTDHRKTGVAAALCDKALTRARQRGAKRVYLLTTTAADYFVKKLGFEPLERVAAPKSVQATHEFSRACPQSAALLSRPL